jgi:pimeloyl-ACP methyl ester carboxylesterase
MPFAYNGDVRIHYQMEGYGPPLVLHHGYASSAQIWSQASYTEALRKDYKLILVEARGHGASDKPHAVEDYALRLRVGDVVTVLDAVGVSRAHFFGYSMGGWIGFGMTKYAPDRLFSLIVGGSHPYGENCDSFRKIEGEDPGAFLDALERVIGEQLSSKAKRLILANDLRALAAAAHPHVCGEGVPLDVSVPCLLFAGEEDPRYPLVKAAAQEIPRAIYFSLPGLGHLQAFMHTERVLPQVKAFLDKGVDGQP